MWKLKFKAQTHSQGSEGFKGGHILFLFVFSCTYILHHWLTFARCSASSDILRVKVKWKLKFKAQTHSQGSEGLKGGTYFFVCFKRDAYFLMLYKEWRSQGGT